MDIPINKSDEQMENSSSGGSQWQREVNKTYLSENAPNILDPDDNLMKKFQSTLEAHLLRVNDRLSEEISTLEVSIKTTEKELEREGTHLYQTQYEVERQNASIEQFKETLTKITTLLEKKNHSIEDAKEVHKTNRSKLEEEKTRKEKLSMELEKLSTLQNRFSKWENDLNNYMKISKQISRHDAAKQKELIDSKQQRDFILAWLEEEIWRLETEIAYLNEQLQIKDKDKEDANRMIVDANTDLEALHKKHRDLHNTWNFVMGQITKRDHVYDQLQTEREQVRRSYDKIALEIEQVKKVADKEMETNEYLTSLAFRIEGNIHAVSKGLLTENEKVANIESQLLEASKLGEQAQKDYNIIYAIYQNKIYEEELISKDLQKSNFKKNCLEDAILAKLEDKVLSDKAIQYINEKLMNSKEAILENELIVARTENSYGNSILEFEKISSFITDQKTEVLEISQINIDKEKQIESLRKEIKKYETATKQKSRKLLGVNKLLEEILPKVGDILSPQDLKITNLEKNIKDLQQDIQKGQQLWLRQQGFMVSLSAQRDSQLQEINLLNKEIVIMEQKNLKLEYSFEMFAMEEANMNKILASLDQKLTQISAKLVAQNDLKEELESKNCIAKNAYILSFQSLQLNLVKLQNDLKGLQDEKEILKEELQNAQRESLSWEKKVQVTQETLKKIKEERTAGGIASMKNEIHKMEMRLSHLRGTQEKLVRDMELCVARRDIMVDKVIGRYKKNPKEKHNKKIVIHKRLADQRAKIKQLLKGMKQIESTSQELKDQIIDTQNKLTQCQETLESVKQKGPNEEEIKRLEVIKRQNLQDLVFKQRKAKLLRDIKNGKYKMIFKNETVIEEDLQNERICRQYLKHVMERTNQDFPMLKCEIHKILLALRIL